MKSRVSMICLVSVALLAGLSFGQAFPVAGATTGSPNDSWNRLAAAKYLDDRETWWQNWPRAQKDQGTVCVSCHTQLPYAMARPILQRSLGETGMNPARKVMMDSVEKRVRLWSEMIPF